MDAIFALRSTDLWEEVKRNVRDKTVYADVASLSALSWACPGGPSSLLEQRAWSLKSLEESVGETELMSIHDAPRLVVLLADPHLYGNIQLLREILLGGKYTECHLYLSLPVSSYTHTWPEELSEEIDEEFLTAQIVSWMAHAIEHPVVSITDGVNMLWSRLVPQVMIVAGQTDVFPALDLDEELAMAADFVSNTFTEERRISLRRLGAAISSALHSLESKGEFFAIGESSKYVARQALAHACPLPGPEVDAPVVSVMIVDRTMDVCAPLQSSTESLLDLVYNTLERKGDGASLDVRIRSTALESDPSPLKEDLFPGENTEDLMTFSLAHAADIETLHLFSQFVMEDKKEALGTLRTHLGNVLAAEAPSAKIPRSAGRVTPALLTKIISVFKAQEQACLLHPRLLELASAIVETLQVSAKVGHEEELAGLEKEVGLCAAGGNSAGVGDVLLGCIPRVGESRGKKGLSLLESLLLALYAYGMQGPGERLEEEVEMKLIEMWWIVAVEEEKGGWGEKGAPHGGMVEGKLELEAWLSRCLSRYREISGARDHLMELRLLAKQDTVIPYTPFVQQLLDEVYRLDAEGDAEEASGDWEHIARSDGALGAVISGFGRLLKATVPHPCKTNRLLLVVVGGITFHEIRIVQETMRIHPEKEVVILSTDIADSGSIARHVLRSSV